MEIEHIRKELNHLLDNVVEHSTRYSEERPIPSLEISFVLTKINKMQENLSVLRHLLEEQEKFSKEARNAERDSVVIEKVQEKTVSVEEKTENHEPTIDVPQKEAVPSDISDNLEQPPIPRLIDALTLNDRYLYANELFNKDMNAFNELVKSIDESSSLANAKELFSSLSWDDENEHVISFNILVERRFS